MSTSTCSVCGEPAEAAALAVCNWCGKQYHLNQRNDVDAKDCGRVWIDEQFLALQFACNPCLATADGDSTSTGSSVQAPRNGNPRRRRYRKRE